MTGFVFSKYHPNSKEEKSTFEKLLDLFLELLVYTSGDFNEAMEWLKELDDQYNLTTEEYSMDNFLKDLEENGFFKETFQKKEITNKTEQFIRKKALDEVFGKLKKRGAGNHRSNHLGAGEDISPERRKYIFGDNPAQIDFLSSFRNAQINHGPDELKITEDDLEVVENEFKTKTSTVLLIDISHSMILYGEDRITPAKKVAMALVELIKKKYPKDTIDIVAFGNDARRIEIKDLPYLTVGPFHTNTVAGLEMAMDLLKKRKNANKQIFMITDGKPSCIKEGGNYYKNSMGLDPKIINKTLNLALLCRKQKIPITTFMIASDPYLQAFVKEFTETNKGKAFYTSLEGLGDFIFNDFQSNKKI